MRHARPVEVQRRWHLTVDRWTHGGCRFTIGNSASVVEHLATKAKIPRHRLRLVRGGIDPAPLQGATPIDRTALGIDSDSPIVLWVGRLDPVKGLSILIDAFRLVAADSNAHLLLAGDGPLRDVLSRQIARCELTSRVHLLGTRDDIPGLLKAANVLNADKMEARDLVTREDTGLLVPYDDTPALARAIVRLLRDVDAARRLARRATRVVTKEWHIERTLAAYAAVYESIGTRPAPSDLA